MPQSMAISSQEARSLHLLEVLIGARDHGEVSSEDRAYVQSLLHCLARSPAVQRWHGAPLVEPGEAITRVHKATQADVVRELAASGPAALARQSALLEALRQREPILGALIQSRLGAMALRYLYQEGHRPRTVLRQGRRLTSSLDDHRFNQGFSLTFGLTTTTFCLKLLQLHSIPRPFTARRLEPLFREAFTDPASGTGDWIFAAQLADRMGRLGTPGEGAWERRGLEGLSPLQALFSLRCPLARLEGFRAQLKALTDPSAVLLLECVEDRLFESWSQQLSAALKSSLAAQAQWLETLAANLEAYVSALDNAQRLDLAGPLLRLTAELVGWMRPSSPVYRALMDQLRGVPLGQRDPILEALGAVAQQGARLLELRQGLAQTWYGDDRYEEAQLFVRQVDECLGSVSLELQGLPRWLRGTIG